MFISKMLKSMKKVRLANEKMIKSGDVSPFLGSSNEKKSFICYAWIV